MITTGNDLSLNTNPHFRIFMQFGKRMTICSEMMLYYVKCFHMVLRISKLYIGKVVKIWKNGLQVRESIHLIVMKEQQGQYGSDGCGNQCIDCHYLSGKGSYFHSTKLNRRIKIRQNVNCLSRNVIYLFTCRKCRMQGVGECRDFKKGWQIIVLALGTGRSCVMWINISSKQLHIP